MSDDGCDLDDHSPSCGHRHQYVSLVVDELIETERSYVRALDEVVHVSLFIYATAPLGGADAYMFYRCFFCFFPKYETTVLGNG